MNSPFCIFSNKNKEAISFCFETAPSFIQKDNIDCIDVSTGGLMDKKPNIPVRPDYQVPYTTAMKEAVSIPVSAVGLLDNPGLCEHILQTNRADLILQGRALIRNVNWLADVLRNSATLILKCTIILIKEGKEGNNGLLCLRGKL